MAIGMPPLLESIFQMPLADANILARLYGFDEGTIRRQCAPYLKAGWVKTITPPCVGRTVSDLYYLTPRGIVSLFPENAEQAMRKAYHGHADIWSLMKMLPRLPHYLMLYECIVTFLQQARRQVKPSSRYSYQLAWEWKANPRLTGQDERSGKPWKQDYHADVHCCITATSFSTKNDEVAAALNDTPISSEPIYRQWRLLLVIDDDERPERDIRILLRRTDAYVSRIPRDVDGLEMQPYLGVITATYVRYGLWWHVVRQLIPYELQGTLILFPRAHGWPYVMGGVVNTPCWQQQCLDMHTMEQAIEPARQTKPSFGFSRLCWLWENTPYHPSPLPDDLPAMQRQFYTVSRLDRGLPEWMAALRRRHAAAVPSTVRRAQYASTMPLRRHQLLTLIAMAPQIGVEDVAIIFRVNAESMTRMLSELHEWVEVFTITGQQGIPGYDEHAILTPPVVTVKVARVTEEGLRYLDGVYESLAIWLHEHEKPTLHDTGVIRCLNMLECDVTTSETWPHSYVWWHVGPGGGQWYQVMQGEQEKRAVNHTLYPDGYGYVVRSVSGKAMFRRFWVEWDMGTMHMAHLTGKVERYRALDAFLARLRSIPERGVLGEREKIYAHIVFVAPTDTQEQLIRGILGHYQWSHLQWWTMTFERFRTLSLFDACQPVSGPVMELRKEHRTFLCLHGDE
jgi:Replication-relaxation